MKKVKVEIGYVHETWGTLETMPGGGIWAKPAKPEHELALWRMTGPTMRRPQDGNDAEFLLGMPARLRSLIWAEILVPKPTEIIPPDAP
jgi:hypothetical protein